MKYKSITIIGIIVLICASCATKLDDVTLNDNPYDSEYEGPPVITVTSVEVDTAVYPMGYNQVKFSKITDKYDGVKLYRSGTLIKTIHSTSPYLSTITDVNANVNVSYTYQVKLFLGSGETASDPYVHTP